MSVARGRKKSLEFRPQLPFVHDDRSERKATEDERERFSVLLKVTSSNTAAPAMMIAEKAAAHIKSDWGVGATQWYGKTPSPLWKNNQWKHH